MSWETILRSKRAVAPRSPASWRMSIRRIDCPLVQSFGQSFYIHSAVSWPYHDPKSSRRWFMGEAGQRFQLWSCLATSKLNSAPSLALPGISRFAPKSTRHKKRARSENGTQGGEADRGKSRVERLASTHQARSHYETAMRAH